ncbi:MAG: hypothetical protein AAFX87_07890 [Bacteroidota bacterium]
MKRVGGLNEDTNLGRDGKGSVSQNRFGARYLSSPSFVSPQTTKLGKSVRETRTEATKAP